MQAKSQSGISQIYELFAGNKTQATTLTLATVITPPPSISVRVDGESMDTPTQGIILAEHLADHTREFSVAGGEFQVYQIKSPLQVNNRVIVAISNDGQDVFVLDKAVI